MIEVKNMGEPKLHQLNLHVECPNYPTSEIIIDDYDDLNKSFDEYIFDCPLCGEKHKISECFPISEYQQITHWIHNYENLDQSKNPTLNKNKKIIFKRYNKKDTKYDLGEIGCSIIIAIMLWITASILSIGIASILYT